MWFVILNSGTKMIIVRASVVSFSYKPLQYGGMAKIAAFFKVITKGILERGHIYILMLLIIYMLTCFQLSLSPLIYF